MTTCAKTKILHGKRLIKAGKRARTCCPPVVSTYCSWFVSAWFECDGWWSGQDGTLLSPTNPPRIVYPDRQKYFRHPSLPGWWYINLGSYLYGCAACDGDNTTWVFDHHEERSHYPTGTDCTVIGVAFTLVWCRGACATTDDCTEPPVIEDFTADLLPSLGYVPCGQSC